MRVVKALVAFMGVLIVVGIGLVVYGLSLDKNNADTSVETSEPTLTPSVPVAGTKTVIGQTTLDAFGDIAIDVDEGERLVGYSINGAQATLHIESRHGEGARLVVVSLAKKKVLGRIILQSSEQ
ncbi:hypothetical protein [Thalassospira sp.]|uniref:hypothetical protein n=1 Tax=Thalassospira sp. TaxID=1912094 RepID=UPI001B28A0C0|nr:hypothetical protein [Thalassospira sp.]MBO6807464.1 hypothetical protein [Thalassospira sp.]MBO6839989.1 hypothetical protein [Thalassospira sp.]